MNSKFEEMVVLFVAPDIKSLLCLQKGKDVGYRRRGRYPDALEQRQHRFFTAAGRKQTYSCPRLPNSFLRRRKAKKSFVHDSTTLAAFYSTCASNV